MNLNSRNVRELSEKITKALEELGRDCNLVLKVNGGTFDHSGTFATLKLEVSTISSQGEVQTKEARAWETYCHRFGFEPEHMGMTFMCNGREFRICGLKPRATKYPVLAKDADGKTYKFAPTMVQVQDSCRRGECAECDSIRKPDNEED